MKLDNTDIMLNRGADYQVCPKKRVVFGRNPMWTLWITHFFLMQVVESAKGWLNNCYPL